MKKLLLILLLTTAITYLSTSISQAGYTISQLTIDSYHDMNPQVSTHGDIVWHGSDGTDNEIFLYDGASTTQLTNNSFNDVYPLYLRRITTI
jgi:hypothetical protein